ncbi:hypothetical protein B0H13DRAFT_1882887 [Mycena leptocephala]|nr:hypothetical protein B0H13DRAFT_1882887 [Mycena leptocephala]
MYCCNRRPDAVPLVSPTEKVVCQMLGLGDPVATEHGESWRVGQRESETKWPERSWGAHPRHRRSAGCEWRENQGGSGNAMGMQELRPPINVVRKIQAAKVGKSDVIKHGGTVGPPKTEEQKLLKLLRFRGIGDRVIHPTTDFARGPEPSGTVGKIFESTMGGADSDTGTSSTPLRLVQFSSCDETPRSVGDLSGTPTRVSAFRPCRIFCKFRRMLGRMRVLQGGLSPISRKFEQEQIEGPNKQHRHIPSLSDIPQILSDAKMIEGPSRRDLTQNKSSGFRMAAVFVERFQQQICLDYCPNVPHRTERKNQLVDRVRKCECDVATSSAKREREASFCRDAVEVGLDGENFGLSLFEGFSGSLRFQFRGRVSMQIASNWAIDSPAICFSAAASALGWKRTTPLGGGGRRGTRGRLRTYVPTFFTPAT